jgi:superfamily II DNA or RNA helicase
MPSTPLNTAAIENLDTHGLTADTHRVALVSALAWSYRTPADLHRLLGLCALKTSAHKTFAAGDVKLAISQLREKGLLDNNQQRGTSVQLVDALRLALYRDLLQTQPGSALLQAVAALDYLDSSRLPFYWPSNSLPTAIAYLRAKAYSGAPYEELQRLRSILARSFDWHSILTQAVLLPFDGPSFEYLDAACRSIVTQEAIAHVCVFWLPEYEPLAEWAYQQCTRDPAGVSQQLRCALAELAVWRADGARLEALLADLGDGMSASLHAVTLVSDGEWAAGQAAFEAAFKQRKSEIGGTKHFLPDRLAWFYPLSLLAQKTPKHFDLARRFCLGESGSRNPSPYFEWGRWVHAIDARLGRVQVTVDAFRPRRDELQRPQLDALWAILLSAWLGGEAISQAGDPGPAAAWGDSIAELRRRLQACRLPALLRLLDGAESVLHGRPPPSRFFIAGADQKWREVLSALQALGEQPSADSNGQSTRLLWELAIASDGEPLDICPLEQKRTQRGWGKPRTVSLTRIAGNQQLAPHDAKVARALRPLRGYSNRYHLDLAAALVALVGHPGIVLAEAPEQLIELTESNPELELLRQGEHFVMRVEPPLRAVRERDDHDSMDADWRREAATLRTMTLIKDAPQRLRLVRFSAAQQQAAQLVSGRFAVPADEPGVQAEIDKALQALAGHFQVHADAAQAAREVDSDSRLRAELSPVGDHLMLRLVVAPLGPEGPRLPAASGRLRLMVMLQGESVGTQRDLNAERRHLETVLDALPCLDGSEGLSEWLIEDPEEALGLVETLPTLAAVAAVDWPKGKSVRVLTIDTRQLGVTIKRERDWFHLSGQASFDEGLVVQLETLLSAARDKSRFVPMGNGVYAALTRSLKQKLNELAAVLEPEKGGGKAPTIAAAWLDEVLDGTELSASRDFRQAIERLRKAQATEPKLPTLLQASLRPYQEDGYQWAVRLATAGMGGCLADDMGLGKTLQALGVLLERAAGGAALVIAPTSVCGNWLAETQRFAPTLNARIYAEASDSEREELVASVGPQDLLIVSYTLLQLAQERFAGRSWHTLIVDEAQAIKNAAAKRSQAVFELAADFRLALTGTPVENRLGDLWSIMRFANPGLLGTVNRFNERFAGPIERNRDREAQHVLKRLIGPFVLRRTKAEVLQELPPRTELVLTVAPEAAEAAHYEALRREAAREIDATLESTPEAQAHFNILAQLTRLRRAACDPRLCSPQFAIAGAKVQAFADLAGELIANGHKALVFSQFVDFLKVLREPLDAAGVRYQYLDGATPAAERSRRVAAFQGGDGDLFLISLKAGGFGLNLTAADYVVITDPWWNPAAEDQAMGRAHRIGQLRPVTVYRLVTKGTVEERIVGLHHEKRALAESILAEGEASALPSTEDLVALIRG